MARVFLLFRTLLDAVRQAQIFGSGVHDNLELEMWTAPEVLLYAAFGCLLLRADH